jgi:DNA polymerase-3 subunit delta'
MSVSVEERMLETARRGELHHAVILHGPAHEKLRAIAIRMAKTLNCLEGSAGGDDCTACQRVDRGVHPDLHIVEVAGDRKMIAVDQIRDLVENATMRPYEGRAKIFIIDPADALSPSGSNSLLKTLEEPTRDTNFILITRSPDLLLPTIKSRSQHVYIGGPETRNDELQATIREMLGRYAERGDSAALLALAAAVSGEDEVKDAIALLAESLAEAAATSRFPTLTPTRLLAAADAAMAAIRHQTVNADARLTIELALAELVG